MAQDNPSPGPIVRKDVVHFDNGSTAAPATLSAFYLLGPDDRQLIEMLQ